MGDDSVIFSVEIGPAVPPLQINIFILKRHKCYKEQGKQNTTLYIQVFFMLTSVSSVYIKAFLNLIHHDSMHV